MQQVKFRLVRLQKKLRAEINECTKDGLTVEAVNRMDYLTAIFKEAMRMFPPFWVTGREALEDDMLGDLKIKQGTVVIVPQFVMQRHPRFWEKPDDFQPDRFLNDGEKNMDEGAYFPFSHGPRKCIGYKVAEIEAKVIFAKLFPAFHVKILNRDNNGFDAGVSLQPQHQFVAEIRRAKRRVSLNGRVE